MNQQILESLSKRVKSLLDKAQARVPAGSTHGGEFASSSGSGGRSAVTGTPRAELKSLGFKQTKVEIPDNKSPGKLKITYEHPVGDKVVTTSQYFTHYKKDGTSTGGGTLDAGLILMHLRENGFKANSR